MSLSLRGQRRGGLQRLQADYLCLHCEADRWTAGGLTALANHLTDEGLTGALNILLDELARDANTLKAAHEQRLEATQRAEYEKLRARFESPNGDTHPARGM